MEALKQFVILEHTESGGVHWDLMLEDAGVLRTWRLDIPPEDIAEKPVKAVQIADHPLRFLDYAGPVQQNTGSVKKADKGPCSWIEKEPSLLIARLDGRILSGPYTLTRTDAPSLWILAKTLA